MPNGIHLNVMTLSNGKNFRVTGHLCGELTGNSPHKGQWRGALVFSLICVWIIGWVNNREAGDLRRYRADFDVSVMTCEGKEVKEEIRMQISIEKTSW